MPEGNGNERVSVSRDALRAELAELELRLEKTFLAALREKADTKVVDQLAQSLSQVVEWRMRAERGEFTRAQSTEIQVQIDETFRARVRASWAGKSRTLTAVAIVISVLGLATSMTYTIFQLMP